MRRYHFLIVEIIVESVNLDTDVKTEKNLFCPHDGEQLDFCKKVNLKTQGKKDVLVNFILQETKNSNLFEKAVLKLGERQMPFGQSWLKLVAIELVN